MKCTKCGFVSFDYLSECKKCGMSLAGTREALGLAAAKPAIPFFLAPLLKDYKEPLTQASPAPETMEDNALPSFDFSDDFDTHAADEVPVQTQNEGGDSGLLEISDEELDFLIQSGIDETGQDQKAAEKLSEPVKDTMADTVAETVKSAETESEELLLDFDNISLPDFSKLDEAPGQNTSSPVELPKAIEPPPAEDESLQIELSEQDLEMLLTELEDPGSKKTDPKNGSGSAKPN